MSDLKVNIITCTYNHQNYIGQCIEGVLMQKTNFDFVHIIGDDASTDKTKDIIKVYIEKNPSKIKLFKHKINVGAPNNATHLFENADARYLAICDGDDYWTDPYKLQKQVDFLEANQDYYFCCTDIINVNENNEIINNKWPNCNNSFTMNYRLLGAEYPIATVTLLFRNFHFNKAMKKTMVKSPLGDYVIGSILLSKGKGKYIHEKTAIYRHHITGVFSNYSLAEKIKIGLHARKVLLSYFRKKFLIFFFLISLKNIIIFRKKYKRFF